VSNNSKYQATFREKQKTLGLVQFNTWVPADKLGEIKTLVQDHIEGKAQAPKVEPQPDENLASKAEKTPLEAAKLAGSSRHLSRNNKSKLETSNDIESDDDYETPEETNRRIFLLMVERSHGSGKIAMSQIKPHTINSEVIIKELDEMSEKVIKTWMRISSLLKQKLTKTETAAKK
jgi:hypothetical protein